jgi:Asp-tRNA(Asn)/Glu-tRNA(Gln) amidotransferase A subunit family amidase
VQLVGRAHDEVTLLRVAAAFERATACNQRRAPI